MSLLLAHLAIPQPALADENELSAPVVILLLNGTWPEELAFQIRADLGASLRERNLLLVEDATTEASATVTLTPPDPDTEVARIVVEDQVNNRQLSREISVAGQPLDTRTVILAACADELLRAAFVDITPRELAVSAMVARSSSPVRELTSPVPDAPTVVETQDQRIFALAVAPAFEAFSGGAVLVGGDIGAAFFFVPFLGIEASVGLRGLIPVRTTQGSIDGTAVNGDLALRVSLLSSHDRFRLELFAGARVSRVEYVGHPNANSTGLTAEAAAVELRAGARGAFAIAPSVQLGVRVYAGAPVLAAIATSDSGDLVGVAGFAGGARLELEWWP